MMQLIAGGIGIAAYGFLIYALLHSDARQSFAAFLLWGMLDSIAAITSWLAHGNFWLALSNASGSILIALVLWRKGKVIWTWFETMTAIMVMICLVVWYTAGETAGLVASSLAVVVASFPQMKDTWKDPSSTPRLPYFIFLVANTVSFLAGKDWSLTERFYPGCSLFLTVMIVGFTFRKK